MVKAGWTLLSLKYHVGVQGSWCIKNVPFCRYTDSVDIKPLNLWGFLRDVNRYTVASFSIEDMYYKGCIHIVRYSIGIPTLAGTY